MKLRNTATALAALVLGLGGGATAVAQSAPPSSAPPSATSAPTESTVLPDVPVTTATIAARYGGLPAHEFVALSPSGDRLAYVTVAGEIRSLLIIETTTGVLLGGARAGEAKVRGLTWLGEDQVVVTVTSTESVPQIGLDKQEITRAEIYDIPSRELRQVLGGTAGVLPILWNGVSFVREVNGRPTLFVETAVFARGGLDSFKLMQIDPAGRGRAIRDFDRRRRSYVGGPDGQPIAQANYYSDTGRWVLQLRRGIGFEDNWIVNALLDQPSLEGLGRSPGTVVVHAARDGKPAQFYEVDVATGVWSDLGFTRQPDRLIRHPRTRLVIGGVYGQGDADEYEFLDPAAQRTWRSAMAAFPGLHPQIVSWSHDLRSVVVKTWGKGDSGSYHVVDLDAGTAVELGDIYPGVTEVGEVRAIRYAAADGMIIPGYLTLPPGVSEPRGLPLVVLPHGGPQARDDLQFDWWAQAIAARGYAVLQPNFRGSDGLGEAHLRAGYGEWGGKMQSDLSDGVRHLAAEGVVDPARVCIVGASYGGYAALAGPTLEPGVYRCAVAVAGVSDLRRMVVWTSDKSGANNSPVVRYWNRFMGAERLGDRSLDLRSPRQQAAKADAPILLLHGRDDTVVPFEQSRIMADALESAGKPFELIALGGEDHWLSRAETRKTMLAETIRWLDTHNPARN